MLFSNFFRVLSVIMSIQLVIKPIQSVIKSIQSVIKKIQLNLVSFSLIFTSRLIATAPTRDWCRVYGLVLVSQSSGYMEEEIGTRQGIPL